MQNVIKRVFGTQNDRQIKRMIPLVERINGLEQELVPLSDADLRARTGLFRERVEKGESLDDLLPEAFATVREAAKRTLGQRHFDVQLIGGIVLHRGSIAEMRTGEGKTLVSTLPAYLNALSGRGVHVVTVNDYLARFHAEWMGEVHRFLGLSVGTIVHGLNDAQRTEAYGSDITYATNNELGFDYLRDNMKLSIESCVQGGLHFAIIDEVDSILIDESRTPLIISGPSEENTQLYVVANRVIPSLKEGTKGDPMNGIEETGDYWIDEKAHSATLTEAGVHKVEKMLGVENLYEPQMLPVLHAVNQALTAHSLKKRDVDYLVEVGESGQREVVIIDEFTGRKMPGRRWSDGLHQAVEAKEGIAVQSENQTLASVTFQNFFRMYDKLAGMTGTADTEAPEFASTYNLDVMTVPTNRPMVRQDLPDVVFKTMREKFNAVAEEIKERQEAGQPVLVGTIAVETSEMLSSKLRKAGVKHNVLNAKHHAREADIVAQAGRKGAVTISTNMAGRGTDILLGGNPEFMALDKCGHDRSHEEFPAWLSRFEAQCAEEREEVVSAGGLHILGTERHESRRIDNQLRGRAGRQGDPGSSQFFLSLEDNLLRIFESERVKGWWDRVGVEEGEAIENRLLSRVIENAQKKVEARNFDIRKHLLEYDDVMNDQRRSFYDQRRAILAADDLRPEIERMVEGIVVDLLSRHWPDKGDPEASDLSEIESALQAQFGVAFDVQAPPFQEEGRLAKEKDPFGLAILERLMRFLDEKAEACAAKADEHPDLAYPPFSWFERDILLRIRDAQWKDHLHTMDGLREGIGLRGYAQRDPKLEYRREGFQLFGEMQERIDLQAVEILFKFVLPEPRTDVGQRSEAPAARPPAAGGRQRQAAPEAREKAAGKVGRNDPCPCGSGKKYKKCCGS